VKIEYTIVFGCPRSGTTFLSKAMNALPNIESLIGTVLPVAIPQIAKQELSPEIRDALAIGFERSLDAYMHSGRFHSRAMALQKWANARNGFGGFLSAIRGQREVTHLVYKEPALAFAPEFVLDAFPQSRIVYIYRDGRDVANSLVRSYDALSDEKLRSPRNLARALGRQYDDRFVPWWVDAGRDDEFIGSAPYVRSIWMWKYMVRECHACFDRMRDPERVLQIRYEDLMSDPTHFGDLIATHLAQESTRASRKQMSSAHTKSIGKYAARNAAEMEAAQKVAEDELRLLGYT
jgi:hypothetical protein